MREFIGWFMVVITLLMVFVPIEVTSIDWGSSRSLHQGQDSPCSGYRYYPTEDTSHKPHTF